MKTVFATAIILTVIFSACKVQKKPVEGTAPTKDTIADYSFFKPLRDKNLYLSTTETIQFDTVYISKDTLHLLTKKITGCNTENFTLLWNGMYNKSLPPQTSVKLFQRYDVDCKERHNFHLTYNLVPVQMKADTSAQGALTPQKTILLRVGGWQKLTKYEYTERKPR